MGQLKIAISEHLVKETFRGVVDNFRCDLSDEKSVDGFKVQYEMSLLLNGGSVEMTDDNILFIKELDVRFDTLRLNFGINIPRLCVGGWCVVPWFDKCKLWLPRYCVFSDNPDITIPLDLSGVVSELSVSASPAIRYVINPERDPNLSDWEAEDKGMSNVYQIYVIPKSLDIDVLDVADMAGNLADTATKKIEDLITSMDLPDWAVDGIMALLGPIPDLLRDILDIGDDIGEWLNELIATKLKFLDELLPKLADYFKVDAHIYEIKDPYCILKAVKPEPGSDTKPLVAVKLPIDQLTATINDHEMILAVEVSVGD